MSVAIHPSETRLQTATPPARRARPHLRLAAGIVLGGTALAGFTAGAFSFFSGLADPRARPVPVAPVASQWPDLKDGVPALAEGPAAQPTRLSLPPARPPAEPPTQRADAAPVQAPPPAQVAKAEPAKIEPAKAEPPRVVAVRTEAAKSELAKPELAKPEPKAEPVRAAASECPNLPIEPAQTLAPSRMAASVAPAKVAAPLAPARAETVRAKAEQPARFVSLPGKSETPKSEASKSDALKAEALKSEAKATPRPGKAEAARKPAARTRVTTADATPAAAPPPSAPAAADDEPELLGVKIPGGRQLREGWNAAVGGLIGKKDGE